MLRSLRKLLYIQGFIKAISNMAKSQTQSLSSQSLQPRKKQVINKNNDIGKCPEKNELPGVL